MNKEKLNYISPQAEVVELIVEQAILSGSTWDLDYPGWGDEIPL